MSGKKVKAEKKAAENPAPLQNISLEFTAEELTELTRYLEAVNMKGTKAEMVQMVNRVAQFQNRFIDVMKPHTE